MKRFSAGKITRPAVLTALALVLSLLEGALPPLFPLPGMKLGLSNVVTLYALYAIGAPAAFTVLVLRIVLGSVFAGQATAFLYSFFGGVFSMTVMAAVKKTRLSIFGVSVSGAAAHACGEILAASLLTGSAAPVAYLAPVLLVSLFTGSLCAFTASLVLSVRPDALH